MTRRLNFWLLAFLFIIGFPLYWYLFDTGAGDARTRPLSMAQLRALADTIPGPSPTQLRAETIGTGSQSANMLAAGTGLRSIPIAVRAYELVVPGKGPILIDAGTARDVADDRDVEFSSPAQDRVDRALRKASGVMILANDDLRNRAGRLRASSFAPVHTKAPVRAGSPAHAEGGNGAPVAVAPGVVAIPLVGLSPGALMVYARLADGREVLFTGEGANIAQSWRQLRPPARLATQGMPAGYRLASLGWLITINALGHQAPQMRIITGLEANPVPFSSGNFSD